MYSVDLGKLRARVANLSDGFLPGTDIEVWLPLHEEPRDEATVVWTGKCCPQWLPGWSSGDLCFAIGILEVELGFPRKDYDLFPK